MSTSPLEEELYLQIKALGLPDPEREYQAVKGRKYRWDFAWPESNLLVEVQGGIWGRGGHSTGAGVTRDCDKLTEATLGGWQSMAFTGKQIHEGQAIEAIARFLLGE